LFDVFTACQAMIQLLVLLFVVSSASALCKCSHLSLVRMLDLVVCVSMLS
jgi:hypothetical protein